MPIELKHVPGRNAGHVVLYALSTCVWCRKTKRLLEELGVEYSYVDVDLLEGEQRREAEREIGRWNPRKSFPTLVVNRERGILGFDEQRIREMLGS